MAVADMEVHEATVELLRARGATTKRNDLFDAIHKKDEAALRAVLERADAPVNSIDEVSPTRTAAAKELSATDLVTVVDQDQSLRHSEAAGDWVGIPF